MSLQKYNEKITQWLEEQKSLLTVEFSGYDHSGAALKEVVAKEEQNLDVFVLKIINTLNTKKKEDVHALFPYFENLSLNRKTAFIFKEHTKIATGTSNKDGIRAFKKHFGVEVVDDIILSRSEAKELLLQEQQKQKDKESEQKREAEAMYFSDTFWDKGYLSSLNAMQKGRLKKSLEKEYNYSGTIMSVKDYLSTLKIIGKEITDKMSLWNNNKVAKMTASEEEEYELKLKNGRLYNLKLDDNYIYEVPKIVYDVLDVEIVGDIALESE